MLLTQIKQQLVQADSRSAITQGKSDESAVVQVGHDDHAGGRKFVSQRVCQGR
jgi:hypothetical protein